MTFGYISPKKYQQRKRRILRDLRIEEVSSVDRGAGHNARVMLMKSWDGVGTEPGRDRGFVYTEQEESMESHSLMRVAKGLGQAVERGLSGEAFAKLETQLAVEMYPDAPTSGHALAKLHASNVGKAAMHKAVQSNYERLQHMSACGDAWTVQKRGGDGTPQVHRDSSKAGAVDRDAPDTEGLEEPYGKRHARLVAAGFTPDESHTMLHRMERLKRGY
jgi:hypothetical protein